MKGITVVTKIIMTKEKNIDCKYIFENLLKCTGEAFFFSQ